jgi:hypothetical protein
MSIECWNVGQRRRYRLWYLNVRFHNMTRDGHNQSFNRKAQ